MNFRINASHNITPNLERQSTHPHTFELCLYIEKASGDFVEFEEMEAETKKYLNRYSGNYLNSIPPFDRMPPTLENMGNAFYAGLSRIFQQSGYRLLRLEISETPCSVYSVAERLFVGSLVYGEAHPVSRLFSKWAGQDMENKT